MEFKFVLRRVIASIITLPVALLGYFLLYMMFAVFGSGPVGSYLDAVSNFPVIAIAWLLVWVFLPVIWRLAETK